MPFGAPRIIRARRRKAPHVARSEFGSFGRLENPFRFGRERRDGWGTLPKSAIGCNRLHFLSLRGWITSRTEPLQPAKPDDGPCASNWPDTRPVRIATDSALSRMPVITRRRVRQTKPSHSTKTLRPMRLLTTRPNVRPLHSARSTGPSRDSANAVRPCGPDPSAGTREISNIRHPNLITLGHRSAVPGVTQRPERTVYDTALQVDLLHVVAVEEIATAAFGPNGPGA